MAAFDFAKVKDPTFFKENVLNAHASFRTYASREEYRTGSSSLALKLDGIWKFAYAKNYTSAIPGFEKTDYDAAAGMTFMFRHTSRWRATTFPSTRMFSIRGMAVKKYSRARSRSGSIRWQAM